MFKKVTTNILSIDLIELLGVRLLEEKFFSHASKNLKKCFRAFVFLSFGISVSYLSGQILGDKASAPSFVMPKTQGLPHVYGPVPYESLIRDHYRFYQTHLRFGAFGSVDLDRISELSKSEFENLLLSAVPASLRSRLEPYIPLALGFSEDYQVDPFWVLAVMWTESHFNSQAESHMNAQGLMQILPGTGAYIYELLGRPSHLVDIDHLRRADVNIEMGVFYLRRLIHRFDGNYRLATVAYNMGTTRVIRRLRNGLPVGVNNLYLNKVRRAYGHLIGPFQTDVMSRPRPYSLTFAAYPRVRSEQERFFAAYDPIELAMSSLPYSKGLSSISYRNDINLVALSY